MGHTVRPRGRVTFACFTAALFALSMLARCNTYTRASPMSLTYRANSTAGEGLQIYQPVPPPKREVPTVVYVHGSGWIRGNGSWPRSHPTGATSHRV